MGDWKRIRASFEGHQLISLYAASLSHRGSVGAGHITRASSGRGGPGQLSTLVNEMHANMRPTELTRVGLGVEVGVADETQESV